MISSPEDRPGKCLRSFVWDMAARIGFFLLLFFPARNPPRLGLPKRGFKSRLQLMKDLIKRDEAATKNDTSPSVRD
jgi:hypothetical protein